MPCLDNSRRLTAVIEAQDCDANHTNRSAIQALLERIKKGLILVLFFEFTDAFGCVSRNQLLIKMRFMEFLENALKHIWSFLSNRCARIKLGNSVGEWTGSNVGTSAGTSLSPLLFIIHVHDVNKCIMPKFADDLAAVSVQKDPRTFNKTYSKLVMN